MVETRTGGGASRRELAASGERGHAAGVTARKLCISSLALLSLAACGGGAGASGGSGKLTAAQVDEVTKIWDARCSNCHGEKGLGDGPGPWRSTQSLAPRDRKWQASDTDDRIRTVIVEGGYAWA